MWLGSEAHRGRKAIPRDLRSRRPDGGLHAPLIDRVIADKMMICGARFPFPGAGVLAKDGNAYTFTPVAQS